SFLSVNGRRDGRNILKFDLLRLGADHAVEGSERFVVFAFHSHTSEIIAIYPITPSSPIRESADAWSSAGKPNIWGTVPSLEEAQKDVQTRWRMYEYLGARKLDLNGGTPAGGSVDEMMKGNEDDFRSSCFCKMFFLFPVFTHWLICSAFDDG